MIVSVHEHLQKPLEFRATRVLITFDDGTPAALIVRYNERVIRVFRAGDKDFEACLRMYNVHQTVVVTPQDFTIGSKNILRPD